MHRADRGCLALSFEVLFYQVIQPRLVKMTSCLTPGLSLVGQWILVRSVYLVIALLGLVPTASAKDVFAWSPNAPASPFDDSRLQGETALATDGHSRIWLSFIDAVYQNPSGQNWVAWPRRLRLFGPDAASQDDVGL